MYGAVRLMSFLPMLAAATVAIAAEQRQSVPASADSNANSADSPLVPELRVPVCRVLGTGRADASPQSVNPPDGLAFTPDGLLLATDAKNHRVQVFDPISGDHLGSFGGPDVFRGKIVAIAAAPNGNVYVSDEKANQVYVFTRNEHGSPLFVPAGPPMLNGAGFQRLTGLASDSLGRLYVVDAIPGVVYRYLPPGFAPDPHWCFQMRRPDDKPMLYRSEGIAIDKKTNMVFVTSEREGMVRVYDGNTGRWLGKTIGRRSDPVSARPVGPSAFSWSAEGLAIFDGYLIAVDEGSKDKTESVGRVLVFRIEDPTRRRPDIDGRQMRTDASASGELIGWFGAFQSPDGVAAFMGCDNRPASFLAVADQGGYRIVLYRGSDLIRAIRSACVKADR